MYVHLSVCGYIYCLPVYIYVCVFVCMLVCFYVAESLFLSVVLILGSLEHYMSLKFKL